MLHLSRDEALLPTKAFHVSRWNKLYLQCLLEASVFSLPATNIFSPELPQAYRWAYPSCRWTTQTAHRSTWSTATKTNLKMMMLVFTLMSLLISGLLQQLYTSKSNQLVTYWCLKFSKVSGVKYRLLPQPHKTLEPPVLWNKSDGRPSPNTEQNLTERPCMVPTQSNLSKPKSNYFESFSKHWLRHSTRQTHTRCLEICSLVSPNLSGKGVLPNFTYNISDGQFGEGRELTRRSQLWMSLGNKVKLQLVGTT